MFVGDACENYRRARGTVRARRFRRTGLPSIREAMIAYRRVVAGRAVLGRTSTHLTRVGLAWPDIVDAQLSFSVIIERPGRPEAVALAEFSHHLPL